MSNIILNLQTGGTITIDNTTIRSINPYNEGSIIDTTISKAVAVTETPEEIAAISPLAAITTLDGVVYLYYASDQFSYGKGIIGITQTATGSLVYFKENIDSEMQTVESTDSNATIFSNMSFVTYIPES